MQYCADILPVREAEFLEEPSRSLVLMTGSFGIVNFGSALEDQQRTLVQILDLIHEIADDLDASARSYPLDDTVTWQTFDKSCVFARRCFDSCRDAWDAPPSAMPEHAAPAQCRAVAGVFSARLDVDGRLAERRGTVARDRRL